MLNLRDNLCFLENTSISVDGDSLWNSAPSDEGEKLRIARDLLLVFVQQNFVGCRRDLSVPEALEVDPKEALKVDSEPLNVNVKNPELLWKAKKILTEIEGKSIPVLFWHMRSIFVHQHVLDERTGGLYSEYKEMVAVLDKELEDNEAADTFLKACAALEMAQGFILFRRITEAGKYLAKAKELLKTQLKLVSMLGYRTRFQTKPLPQLALKVISADETLPKSSDTHLETELPKLLLLEDDTRLEKVKFVEEKDNQIGDLSSVLQCLIITEM